MICAYPANSKRLSGLLLSIGFGLRRKVECAAARFRLSLRPPPRASATVKGVKLIHPSPDKVPGLAPVATALRRARTIRCQENDFAVGVCNAHGQVIAGTLLDCYRQVSKFSSEMRKLGYAPVIVDNDHQMQGFDVVYVRAMLH